MIIRSINGKHMALRLCPLWWISGSAPVRTKLRFPPKIIFLEINRVNIIITGRR
jgi:hypothetical protein